MTKIQYKFKNITGEVTLYDQVTGYADQKLNEKYEKLRIRKQNQFYKLLNTKNFNYKLI